jgi:hypothetical protein
MTDFDPMKATAEERERALLVIGWTLTIIKNSTVDAKVHRAVERADRALNSLARRIAAQEWPPAVEK